MFRRANGPTPRAGRAGRYARLRSTAVRCRDQQWFDPNPAFSKAAFPRRGGLLIPKPPRTFACRAVEVNEAGDGCGSLVISDLARHHPFGLDDVPSGPCETLSQTEVSIRPYCDCVAAPCPPDDMHMALEFKLLCRTHVVRSRRAGLLPAQDRASLYSVSIGVVFAGDSWSIAGMKMGRKASLELFQTP